MKTWTISTPDIDKRIDVFLNEHMDLSRSKIAIMIKEGKVLCNAVAVKAKYKLRRDDILEVADFEVQPMRVDSITMPLDIVFEDDDLLVVNKPRGLVVHPGKGVEGPTLLNGLVAYLNQNPAITVRPGMVHRIDKDTSGLLVIAKNDKTHTFLAEQLLDKTMQRYYLALVHGTLHEDCSVDAPIGLDPVVHRKMAVTDKNSKPALTHFFVKDTYPHHSLIECRLKTGRTHQIRVHAQSIGHPLIGDPLYGRPEDTNREGQYLFAYHLEFLHPKTKTLVSFEVPYPTYFSECIHQLQAPTKGTL
ncbi:RluA family pseudouridine synthase [Erysipelothrix sp. HDW6C]|uniref:RluA family pseudouridine synthase n=1 Tax=Erysipelothrix sp. HDW6C TaxID=2714930 RepID=UPI001407C3DD|nr:RluA family pseudouridine synthase [Erysipelothrix sp. HDW6C]QIK70759.1 RluA family pseudouridine synthase [Erysipelothrix sp. HDW6C]